MDGYAISGLTDMERAAQCANTADALIAALKEDKYLSDPINADRTVVQLIRSLEARP